MSRSAPNFMTIVLPDLFSSVANGWRGSFGKNYPKLPWLFQCECPLCAKPKGKPTDHAFLWMRNPSFNDFTSASQSYFRWSVFHLSHNYRISPSIPQLQDFKCISVFPLGQNFRRYCNPVNWISLNDYCISGAEYITQDLLVIRVNWMCWTPWSERERLSQRGFPIASSKTTRHPMWLEDMSMFPNA